MQSTAMRDEWDDIPEDDVDEVFRDVLELVMDKMQEGCNPMALAGVMMAQAMICLLYTSPSPRDPHLSRMPSSA